MKILHIAFTFGYGGIETMLANIANAQVDFGHKVSIIIPYVKDNKIDFVSPARRYKTRKNGCTVSTQFRLSFRFCTFAAGF